MTHLSKRGKLMCKSKYSMSIMHLIMQLPDAPKAFSLERLNSFLVVYLFNHGGEYSLRSLFWFSIYGSSSKSGLFSDKSSDYM